MHRTRLATLTAMIFFAAVTRVLPHPPNFTPIAAIALFGGATFASKRLALVMTLAALFLSDLLLEVTIRAGLQPGWLGAASSHGFHKGWWVVYGCFALTVGLGCLLRGRRTVPTVALATLTSSILFFVVTNFMVWEQSGLYPRNLSGFVACYAAAIPFFGWTLAGDAVYAAALFGGLAFAEHNWSVIRERKPMLPNHRGLVTLSIPQRPSRIPRNPSTRELGPGGPTEFGSPHPFSSGHLGSQGK